MAQAPTDNEEFIFERVKERYEFENERFLNVQDKASNLIGWIGLFLSVLTAGGSLLFLKTGETLKISTYEMFLLLGTLVLLLISMGISLYAYRVGTYDVVPAPKPLIRKYGTTSGSKKKTLRVVTSEMANAIETNANRIDSIANWVTCSWGTFLAGMIVSTIFISQIVYKLQQ